MDGSFATPLGLGLLLGLRHALDADHVAAVSTLVGRHGSVTRSAILGAFWGAGHTLALLAAGIAVFAFRVTISAEVERGLEIAVAIVLMLLGGHALLQATGALVLHAHERANDGWIHRHVHVHVSSAASGHVHVLRLGGRPFLVGLLHGLAGSAALTLLVLTAIPSLLGGLLYILVFGVGSTAGMLLLSGLIGIPFALTARRAPRVGAAIQALAGAVSVLLGGWLLMVLAGA